LPGRITVSFEGVVKAKSELYEYLGKTNGIVFYDDKNPLLAGRIYELVNRAVPFCDPTGSELKVEMVQSDLYLKVEAFYRHRSYEINTRLFGSYNLDNIRAALATGLFFGVEMQDIADAVENYLPSNNRSQVRMTGRNTLICDSYNANPVSLFEALKSFAGISTEKKAVILGDMLELGLKSSEEHDRIIKLIGSLRFDRVILVGSNFEKASEGSGFSLFPDVNALAVHLKSEPLDGMTVLVKGSRGMGLEKIYELL
jgi:UDP-N-acetylmuramoyl-tripeptide--D-alanyl-D-alanine ligase